MLSSPLRRSAGSWSITWPLTPSGADRTCPGGSLKPGKSLASVHLPLIRIHLHSQHNNWHQSLEKSALTDWNTNKWKETRLAFPDVGIRCLNRGMKEHKEFNWVNIERLQLLKGAVHRQFNNENYVAIYSTSPSKNVWLSFSAEFKICPMETSISQKLPCIAKKCFLRWGGLSGNSKKEYIFALDEIYINIHRHNLWNDLSWEETFSKKGN